MSVNKIKQLIEKYQFSIKQKNILKQKIKSSHQRNNQDGSEDNLSKKADFFTRIQFSTKQRMRIYEKLAKFIENGVPLPMALDQVYIHASLEGKKPKLPAATAIDCWRRAIRNGNSFSTALFGWAPIDEISIINAGELSGRLHKSINDVIFLYGAKKKIRSALSGISYPIALLLATCFFMIIFGIDVVPAFAQILPVSKWTGSGATLALMANFVQNDLAITITTVCLFFVIVFFTFPTWCSKGRVFVDRFPPWSLYRIFIGCGFLISLAALLDAGIAAPQALELMGKSAKPWYKQKLTATRRALLNGVSNIGDALHSTNFKFPSSEMIIDLRAYAGLDGFEEMLEKLAHQWQEESVKLIELQMAILRNAAIIIMGFVFMWIVSGMFNLEMQISNMATTMG